MKTKPTPIHAAVVDIVATLSQAGAIDFDIADGPEHVILQWTPGALVAAILTIAEHKDSTKHLRTFFDDLEWMIEKEAGVSIRDIAECHPEWHSRLADYEAEQERERMEEEAEEARDIRSRVRDMNA